MSTEHRAETWTDGTGTDTRTPFDPVGDERTLLVAFLRWQRETIAAKCADLTAEQLAERSVPPSTMSLLGVVRHMARVEQGWFTQCVLGQPVEPLYRGPQDMDGEWDDAVGTDECVREAFETWRAECRSADAVLAEHDLETPSPTTQGARGASGPCSCT